MIPCRTLIDQENVPLTTFTGIPNTISILCSAIARYDLSTVCQKHHDATSPDGHRSKNDHHAPVVIERE